MEQADKWFQITGSQGLAFAFTAGFLLLMLYLVFVVVGLLREWLPKWFEASIFWFQASTKSHERLCETMDVAISHCQSTRAGIRHALDAAHLFLNKSGNKERLGVSSDVILRIDEARSALRKNTFGTGEDDED